MVEPTLRAATPGDLSFALPYRHLRDLIDMLDALDALLPGVGGRDTLLYGAEVKFYSSRLALDPDLQTPVAGLYAVGDGAGVTRGLVQASASGLVAARAVAAGAWRPALSARQRRSPRRRVHPRSRGAAVGPLGPSVN